MRQQKHPTSDRSFTRCRTLTGILLAICPKAFTVPNRPRLRTTSRVLLSRTAEKTGNNSIFLSLNETLSNSHDSSIFFLLFYSILAHILSACGERKRPTQVKATRENLKALTTINRLIRRTRSTKGNATRIDPREHEQDNLRRPRGPLLTCGRGPKANFDPPKRRYVRAHRLSTAAFAWPRLFLIREPNQHPNRLHRTPPATLRYKPYNKCKVTTRPVRQAGVYYYRPPHTT